MGFPAGLTDVPSLRALRKSQTGENAVFLLKAGLHSQQGIVTNASQ